MTRSTRFVAATAVLFLLGLLGGCQGGGKRPPRTARAAPRAPAPAGAPSWSELRGATFHGLEESAQPVTLHEGRWEGPPFAPGAASFPSVELLPGFELSGDLDGDGANETVALLAGSSGGTGVNNYLAVVGRRSGELRNLGTALLGDRVELRQVWIDGRRIRLELVQAAPSDPMCCPGELVSRSFELTGNRLREPVPGTSTGRLSLATIGERAWVLRAWNMGEAAPESPAVTLLVKEGRISGNAGCNGYFATASEGSQPGAVVFGPAGATKKMCPPPLMQVEDRFLPLLGQVVRYGFHLGRLALTYRTDLGVGTMLFEEQK